MNQVLHIFRKDTRRFWLEIIAALAILAAYAFLYPNEWQPFESQGGNSRITEIVGFVLWLVPLSWLLLITRVVHGESLVGDSEFWITRPYEWKNLLAAKLLFIAAWIGVPFLITQFVLLAQAGFNPLSYIPGLLAYMLIASAVLMLPLLSIAAVTASFARMMLTLLSGFILAVIITFFYNTGKGYTNFSPYRNHLIYPLLSCVCAATILVQYATRRVWFSRALLMALPLLIMISVSAYRRQSLIDRAYPQPVPSSIPPMRASFVPSANHRVLAREWQGEDFIDLPIHYSEIVGAHPIITDNLKFTLTTADGDQWTSPWQLLGSRPLQGEGGDTVSLKLSPALFDRFKSGPVTVHLTFALTRLQPGPTTQMLFPLGDVALPGVGVCSPVYNRGRAGWSAFFCRSAFRQPQLSYVTAVWSNTPCSDPPPAPDALEPSNTWVGVLASNDAELLRSSVFRSFIAFNQRRVRSNAEYSDPSWHICPGSPLTITPYHVLDRTQTDLTIPNFQFPAVAYKN